MQKTIRLFASTTTATITQTIPWTSSNLSAEGGPWSSYVFMDVIANVKTIQGTNPGVFITIQEQFPNGNGGSTYMTTAQTNGSIQSAGPVYLTNGNSNLQTGTPYAAPGTQQNGLLGMGMAKQVLFSATGTVNTINADIIFVFYDS